MNASLVVWLVPMFGVLALALSAFNALFWPRGRHDGDPARLGRTSVCIPARNEAASIAACVKAALALDPFEVVVVDDGSTDATPDLLQAIAATDPRLRVVRVDEPLPRGWVGKPRACAKLVEHAGGDSLLFLDADVVADLICAALLDETPARQQALEETALLARLRRANDALASLLLRTMPDEATVLH